MAPKTLTVQTLAQLQGVIVTSNLTSLHEALVTYGAQTGLDRFHRLVPFLANTGHETADYRYDREVWGPTPAQKRYDTRTDLGNTAAVDGDGFKNRGHGTIQVTGGFNIAEFRDWCRKHVDPKAPDFAADPGLICTDPWEGLSAVWYWSTRKLNAVADQGDLDRITKVINGGYNGHPDRLRRFARIGLAVLGYGTGKDEVLRFQRNCGFLVHQCDGVLGPKTRKAIHNNLAMLPTIEFIGANPAAAPVPQSIGFVEALVALLKSLVTKGK